MAGLRPFVSIPKDIREWTRWSQEALEQGSVGTAQLEDGAVTVAKIAPLAARSVIGNATAAIADPTEITASADDRILSRTSGTLGFTQLTSGMFPNNVVPDSALSVTIPSSSSGNYTATLTGCTTSPTGTVSYLKVGAIVILTLPSLSATSNSTACTLTGPAPTAIRPGVTQIVVGRVLDNSVSTFGLIEMDSAGLITLRPDAAGGTFTAANSKGSLPCSVAYSLI